MKVKIQNCAGCAGKIQHKAGTMAGVLNANLDLYKKRFTLETDENYEEELFYMRLISLLILQNQALRF